jgi:predicted negative regulator of RcsB-dependent stress response
MTKTGDAARPLLDQESLTALETLQKYQRPITIGAIVVAVGLGGGWLYQRSAEIKETKGAQALGQAEAAYSAGNTPLAQEELAKVVTRYAGTTAGAQAALLGAQLHYEAGHIDSGVTQLTTALGKAKAFQKTGLLALRAAGKGTAGQHAEAATDFEAAAAAARFQQEKDQYMMEAARQHVMAGNVEAARSTYQSIANREDSAHSTEARLRLGELTLKSS